MAIAPWLSVSVGKSAQAIGFYKSAFGAVEVFRVADPDGNVVARLAIEGSEFWVADESPEHHNFSPATLGGGTVRLVLTVADPDTVFVHAIAKGATEVVPVAEMHGWRVGRILDPYGHHWEIGRELNAA